MRFTQTLDDHVRCMMICLHRW